MAKAKYKSTHHLQKLFIIFGALFSLAALGIIVYSSQQQTNTQSDASGCTSKPNIQLIESNAFSGRVVYELKVVNTCASSKRFRIKVTKFPTTPESYTDWRWRLSDASNPAGPGYEKPLVTDFVGNSQKFKLEIYRPFGRENMKEGVYKYFRVRAAFENNSNIYDTLDLTYIIGNKYNPTPAPTYRPTSEPTPKR